MEMIQVQYYQSPYGELILVPSRVNFVCVTG